MPGEPPSQERSSPPSAAGRRRLPLALALPPAAAGLGLAALPDLPHHLPAALGLLGASFLWLAVAARILDRRPAGRALPLLLGALLLRLPLLALPPALSDEAPRLLGDGRIAAAGLDPYALAPGFPPPGEARPRSGPHARAPSVALPLAIAASSIVSRFPFAPAVWKGVVTAADLAACALLAELARRRGLPEHRILVYAWNPLVALEGAGMGHAGFLGVAAALAAVLALTPRPPVAGAAPARRKVDGAAAWGALAALAHPLPLVALPMWARLSGRPGRFLAVALGLLAVAAVPVLRAAGGLPAGIAGIGGIAGGAGSPVWNGPLLAPLRWLLELAGAPRPQLLALALMALGMLAAVARSLRERDAVAGAGRLLGGLLLLSPVVQPWHLIWVLPWAALAGGAAWLALSATALLSYLARPTGGSLPLFPWIFLAVWGPFAVLAAVGAGRAATVRRRRAAA